MQLRNFKKINADHFMHRIKNPLLGLPNELWLNHILIFLDLAGLEKFNSVSLKAFKLFEAFISAHNGKTSSRSQKFKQFVQAKRDVEVLKDKKRDFKKTIDGISASIDEFSATKVRHLKLFSMLGAVISLSIICNKIMHILQNHHTFTNRPDVARQVYQARRTFLNSLRPSGQYHKATNYSLMTNLEYLDFIADPLTFTYRNNSQLASIIENEIHDTSPIQTILLGVALCYLIIYFPIQAHINMEAKHIKDTLLSCDVSHSELRELFDLEIGVRKWLCEMDPNKRTTYAQFLKDLASRSKAISEELQNKEQTKLSEYRHFSLFTTSQPALNRTRLGVSESCRLKP